MRKISRRAILLTALGGGTSLPAAAQSLSPLHSSIGQGPMGLTAEITFAGGVPTDQKVVFAMALGTDLGNYVAPTAGFTQRCIRCRSDLVPNFFVDFRPDTTGSRVEVVFWNGECMGTVPSGYSRNLAAYNAVVKNNGAPLADFLGTTSRRIQFHNWGCRWRFQSATRPVIRTAAQVFSEGWLPHMSQTAARIKGYSGVIAPPVPAVPTKASGDGTNGDGSPMTIGRNGPLWLPYMKQDPVTNRLLGILCRGDTGGARDELGLITEWQGDWLLRGTATSLNLMFQHAEFFSSQANAIFLPDQVAAGPVNQKADAAHYKATMLQYGSYYFIDNGSSQGSTAQTGKGEFVSKGNEHSPQAWYLPYVLTEDPYFIEGQQYHETFATSVAIYHKERTFGRLAADPTGQSGVNGAFTLFPHPAVTEERALGWGLKNVASCYKMSPITAPAWLLPKSYWAAVSSDYSAVITAYRNARPADPYYTVFHSITCGDVRSDDTPQSFYKAYVTYSMGFADLVGCPTPAASGKPAPPTWAEQLDYVFDWFRNTANPTARNGWNPQEPLVHDLGQPAFMSNSGGPPSHCGPTPAGGPIPGNNCVSTYAQLWAAAKPVLDAIAGQPPPYPDNPSPGYQGPNPGNLTPCYAAAAVAKSRGVTAASGIMKWMGSMIDFSFPQAGFTQAFTCRDGFDGT